MSTENQVTNNKALTEPQKALFDMMQDPAIYKWTNARIHNELGFSKYHIRIVRKHIEAELKKNPENSLINQENNTALQLVVGDRNMTALDMRWRLEDLQSDKRIMKKQLKQLTLRIEKLEKLMDRHIENVSTEED